MKKHLLQIIFLILMLPAISQAAVIITGTITDSANNSPIPNHAVYIVADSSNGFVYFNTVYTNSYGVYYDSVPAPANSSGAIFIQTLDCNNDLHQATINYTPTNLYFTQDFQICNSTSPCTAYFSYNTAGLTVQFYDYSSGGNGPWDWNFGDGGTSSIQNPSHSYSYPGQYVVTLAYGDPNTNCYDVESLTIYLNDTTGGGCTAAFTYIPDSVNNPPYTYQFIDQSTGNIISWLWDFGDPGSGTSNTSNLQNPTHVFSAPGAYYVCLTIQGADSTCYDVTCNTVIVGNNTGCQADFTYYPDSSYNMIHFIDQSFGNIISWAWNFGDGSPVGTGQNPTHVYPAPGSYTVCLTIQGADSTCYDITCKTVVVGNNQGCQANFTYTINPAPGNHTVDFTDLSTGNPLTWLWDFGGGYTSLVQNPSFTFPAPGAYPVCLTITGNNCTSTFCNEVVIQDSLYYHQVFGQVFEGNTPLQTGLTLIVSLDTNLNYPSYIEVCMIDSMGFYHFNTVPDGHYLVYAIPFDSNGYLPTYYGDVLNWAEAIVIVLGEANNPYNINLIQSAYMPQGPGSVSGQVNMSSIRSGILDKMTMLLMDAEGHAISFNMVSESGSFAFPSMEYGTYYLYAELSGITSDYVKVILTPEKPHADVVMTFAGKHVMGIKNMNPGLEAGVIYPNPAIDKFNLVLNLKEAATIKVEIFNQRGQNTSSMIKSLGSGQTTLTLSVSDLTPGFYTLRLTSEKGINMSRKLLIAK